MRSYVFAHINGITLQNCIPLTLLPCWSKGGDQTIIPHTFGTTIKIAPLTPDLAGNPTWVNRNQHQND